MVNFPTTLDNDASLHVAKNNLYTTLNAQLLIGETTTMEVVSTTNWDSAGYLSVDNEIIYYASTDPTHFLTLTRARDGTSAAQHEVGTVVELRPVAMHHNDPKDAIVALETKVGVDSSAVATTIDYLVKNPLAVNPGHLHDALTFTNSGLHILDTNASHDLIITPGSDITADRILTITTGDAARTITLNGSPTLNDWFDQSVKQAASPTFAGATITGLAGVLKASAGVVSGSATLDDVADGSSYKRVVVGDITSGHIIQMIAGGETLTPVGTTSDTFQLNTDATGVKLKDNSGNLSIRTSTDMAYADLYCNNIVQAGTFVTPATRVSTEVADTTPITPWFAQFIGWGTDNATPRNSGDNFYHAAIADMSCTGGDHDVLVYSRTSATDTAAGTLQHTFTGGIGTWSSAAVGWYFCMTAASTSIHAAVFTIHYVANTPGGGGGGSVSYTNLTVTGNALFYQTNATNKLVVKDLSDNAVLTVDTTNDIVTVPVMTISGIADSTTKLAVIAQDATHVVDVDTTNKKLKVNNTLEFQANATITNATGTLTLGNSTSQTYFGPDGGATAHHIELENGTIAVRYTNAASAVAIGQAVYISAADTVALAKADAIATMPAIGVVVATPTTTACFVSEIGRIGSQTFASANANVYVSDVTAGLLSLTLPSGSAHVIQKMGKSRSLTDLDIKVDQQFLVLL